MCSSLEAERDAALAQFARCHKELDILMSKLPVTVEGNTKDDKQRAVDMEEVTKEHEVMCISSSLLLKMLTCTLSHNRAGNMMIFEC